MKKQRVIISNCSRDSLANPFSGVSYSKRIKDAGIKGKSKKYKTVNDGKYSRIISR